VLGAFWRWHLNEKLELGEGSVVSGCVFYGKGIG
jgi:hypothetical protein